MAEYTIKLKLDNQALTQMNKAFGKAMGSTAAGTMFGGGGAGFTGAQNQRLFNAMVKNLRSDTKLTNKRLEQLMTQHKKGIMGVFGPQLMKIAGFTLGLAGIVAFGIHR